MPSPLGDIPWCTSNMSSSNDGLSSTLFTLNVGSKASAAPDDARYTVMLYNFLVPSWAVTATPIVFWPTAKGIACDFVPDVTGVPFTIMVAFASVVTGATVMLVLLL